MKELLPILFPYVVGLYNKCRAGFDIYVIAFDKESDDTMHQLAA